MVDKLSVFENKFRKSEPDLRYAVLYYFLKRRDFYDKITSFSNLETDNRPFDYLIGRKKRGDIIVLEMIAYSQKEIQKELAKFKEYVSNNPRYKDVMIFCSPSSIDFIKEKLGKMESCLIIPSDAFLFLGVDWSKLDENKNVFIPHKNETHLSRKQKDLLYKMEEFLSHNTPSQHYDAGKIIVPYGFDIFSLTGELVKKHNGKNFLIVTPKPYRLERYIQSFSCDEDFSYTILPFDKEKYINIPSYSFQGSLRNASILKNFDRVSNKEKKSIFFVSTEMLSYIQGLQNEGLPFFDLVIFEDDASFSQEQFLQYRNLLTKKTICISFVGIVRLSRYVKSINFYQYNDPLNIQKHNILFSTKIFESNSKSLEDMLSVLKFTELLSNAKEPEFDLSKKDRAEVIVFDGEKNKDFLPKEPVKNGKFDIFYFNNIADVKKIADKEIDVICFINGVSREIIEFFLTFQGDRKTIFCFDIEYNKNSRIISKKNKPEDMRVLFDYAKKIASSDDEIELRKKFIKTILFKPSIERKKIIENEFDITISEEDADEMLRPILAIGDSGDQFNKICFFVDGKEIFPTPLREKLIANLTFFEFYNPFIPPQNLKFGKNDIAIAKLISTVLGSFDKLDLFGEGEECSCYADITCNPSIFPNLLQRNFKEINDEKVKNLLKNSYIKANSLDTILECIVGIKKQTKDLNFFGNYFLLNDPMSRLGNNLQFSFVFLDLLDYKMQEAIIRFDCFRNRLKDKSVMCVIADKEFVFSPTFKKARIELSYECSSIHMVEIKNFRQKKSDIKPVFICFSHDSDAMQSFFYSSEVDFNDKDFKLDTVGREFDYGDDWLFDKEEKALSLTFSTEEEGVFTLSSFGVLSNRDNFVWNFSKTYLIERMKTTIDTYNQDLKAFVYEDFLDDIQKQNSIQIKRTKNNQIAKSDLHKYLNEKSITMDESKISWSIALKSAFIKKIEAKDLDQENIRVGLSHPFLKRFIYLDKFWVDRVGQAYLMFPKKESENLILVIDKKSKTSFISKYLVGIHCIGDSLMLPLYVYKEDGSREYAISEDVIKTFKTHYKNKGITAEDIFYYIFALLQNHTFSHKQDCNQNPMSIPLLKNFFDFVKCGRELAVLYTKELGSDLSTISNEYSWQLQKNEKIIFDAKNGAILFGDKYQITNIPNAFFEAKVGHRTFASWCGECLKKLQDDIGINSSNIEKIHNYCQDLIGISEDAQPIIDKIQSIKL